MLFSYLTSFLLGLFLFCSAVESKTDETLELKFHNRHLQASSSAMCAMLKRANLENNGYQKKVITNVVEEPGSDKSKSQTVYYYERSVECSYKAMEDVGQQLNTSLPGVFGKEMRMKLRKEMKLRHLNDAGQCKMGLEVDFKDGLGCDVKYRKRQTTVVIVTKDVIIIINIPM